MIIIYSQPRTHFHNLIDDRSLMAQFDEDLSEVDEDGLSLYDEVITYGSDPTLQIPVEMDYRMGYW